jgi:hypothetical protein
MLIHVRFTPKADIGTWPPFWLVIFSALFDRVGPAMAIGNAR